MAAAKKSTQEFSKTVGDMSAAVEDSLGIPIGAITEVGSKLKNVATLFKGASAQGETAFQKIALGAGVAAGAIAGIGITGLIASFKILNDEAERYRNTVEGTSLTLQTDAWTNTFQQYISDSTQLGKKTAETLSGWSKYWTTVKSLGGQMLKASFGDEDQFIERANELEKVRKEAEAAAKKAAVYAKEIFDTTEAMKDKSIEWKKNLADVADLMLVASDTSKSTKERQDAVTKAIALQKSTTAEQVEMQKKVADNIKAQNDLASSSVEDMDRQRNAYAAVNDLQRECNQKLRRMVSLQNTIQQSVAATGQKWRDGINKAVEFGMTEIAKYNAEMEKAMEMRDKMASDNIFAPLKALPGSLTGKADNGVGLMGGINMDESALKGLKQFTQFDTSAVDGLLSKIDPSKLSESFKGYYNFLDEMIKATDDANKALNEAIVGGISDSFQYLANCVAGLDEMSGAGMMNALLSPLAEAAIKMGEIMVSAGLASEAFKSMLTNPYTAIAAGAALIAVGAAAKAGLQAAVNSATGTSYVASSVASSGYSNNNSGDRSWEREMTLHVIGTLQADGSKLVAVLNNEANRKRYTT
nr:MAG TPA: hypothetical protein [Caudoviricetes sp.]